MKTKISIAALLVLSVLFLAGCQSSASGATPQLSEAEARDIALKDVGISLNDVSFLHIEKEADDGITKYDVTFRHEAYEYEYEIDAATGKIIGFDKDTEDAPVETPPVATEPVPTEAPSKESDKQVNSTEPTKAASSTSANTSSISKAKAKSIALNHAGLKESEVTGLRVTLEKDDGKTYYEVDFRKGNVEYDYEINPTTGKIVEWDKDIDD